MAKKIKVLLVDDEKEFLESLSERFELRGFEVYKAQSGPEALQVAEKTKVQPRWWTSRCLTWKGW